MTSIISGVTSNPPPVRMVWIYRDYDTYREDIGMDAYKVFGNRADALVFAYHELFQWFIDWEKKETFPISVYDGRQYVKTNIPEDMTLWPKTPTACALYLRELVSENGRYLIDDHMDDVGRWGSPMRQNDLDVGYGNIDISVHDECGLTRWHNSFGIDLYQYPLIDNVDDLKTLKPIIDGPKPNMGGNILLPHNGLTYDMFDKLNQQTLQQNFSAVDHAKLVNVKDIPKGTTICSHNDDSDPCEAEPYDPDGTTSKQIKYFLTQRPEGTHREYTIL